MPLLLRHRPTALFAAMAVLAAGSADAQNAPAPVRIPQLAKPGMPLIHGSAPIHLRNGEDLRRRTPQPLIAPQNAANSGNNNANGGSPNGGTGQPDAATTHAASSTGASGAAADDNGKRALPRAQIQKNGKFKLQFDKVDIEELVKQVADMTGKMFIVPDNIRGKITIIGPQHGEEFVSAEEVYAAFLAALDANGWAVYPTGKFLRLEEKRNAKQSTIPTYLEDQGSYPVNEQMITKLFRLKYADLEPVRGALQNLASPNGECQPFQPDLLICTDLSANMHRLERILGELDQPGGIDTIHIVQIQYAAAADLADKLTKIFEQKKGAPGQRVGTLALPRAANGVPIHGERPVSAANAGTGPNDEGTPTLRLALADERTNKLVVIASDKSFDRILAIIHDLDVPTSGEGGVHVYYLQNAAAEELANTLSNLTQGANNRPKKGGPQGGAATAELFSGEVKITAEKSTNSLVIIASDPDYRNLVRVIEKLDLARREVFVEAVIMEVDLDDNTDFGARLHTGLPPFNVGSNGQAVSLVADQFGESTPPSFSLLNLASFGGFLAGLQGPAIPELQKFGINVPSFGVLIHALTTNNKVNVLSTPHILTTDNEEAEITVGQNVPFQAGFSPSSLGSSINSVASLAGAGTAGVNTSALGGLGGLGALGGLGSFFAPIQRQNVELKLKIKPQINEGDTIRMVVDEQTEEIASQDKVLGPTTSKRSAKTTIVVKDQQTVVIGGLIQEHNIESVNKVPVLGDIPVIGHLFREETRHKIRTNLLLFLTPYIIREQSDFQRIFERKLKERQDFVEEFYGQDKEYEAFIDYTHKAGPLSKMRSQLRAEANKIENGGNGNGSGQKLITPIGSSERVNPDVNRVPPSGRPAGGSAGEPSGAPPAGGLPPEAAPAPANAPVRELAPAPVQTSPEAAPAPAATPEGGE